MPRAIDLETLQRLLQERASQLVEVLPEAEFEEEHLPGAISLSLKRLNRVTASVLDPQGPVIVYCWDDI